MKLIHHGIDYRDFEASRSDTDYILFHHTSCKDEPNQGYCEVIAVLLDHHGRVIFNLRCQDCNSLPQLMHEYLALSIVYHILIKRIIN